MGVECGPGRVDTSKAGAVSGEALRGIVGRPGDAAASQHAPGATAGAGLVAAVYQCERSRATDPTGPAIWLLRLPSRDGLTIPAGARRWSLLALDIATA